MDTLVLKIAYGGLGDHLFYSPLPRIAKQTGAYTRVLISNHSDFRSSAYRSLIWETNPYVDGFTGDDAAAPVLGYVRRGHNLLDTVMLAMGLDDGIRMHEPEVYFTPTLKPELACKVVYDPNWISGIGAATTADVRAYFEGADITPDFMLKEREKSCPVQKYGDILETTSFEDYCSAIVSAGTFICLTSGGATLSAALGKPATVLWGSPYNPMFRHSPMHTYVNIHQSLSQRYLPQLAPKLDDIKWPLRSYLSRVKQRYLAI